MRDRRIALQQHSGKSFVLTRADLMKIARALLDLHHRHDSMATGITRAARTLTLVR